MPNWTTITETNLNAASASGKVSIFRSIASKKSMPDPVPQAIDTITKELRGAIGFSGKYDVDSDLTKIPSSLLDLAIKKIVRDISRAVSIPLTEDERGDEKTYESRLDKIRSGEWPIETPDNPINVKPVQTSVVVPSIKTAQRQFTAGNQDGM